MWLPEDAFYRTPSLGSVKLLSYSYPGIITQSSTLFWVWSHRRFEYSLLSVEIPLEQMGLSLASYQTSLRRPPSTKSSTLWSLSDFPYSFACTSIRSPDCINSKQRNPIKKGEHPRLTHECVYTYKPRKDRLTLSSYLLSSAGHSTSGSAFSLSIEEKDHIVPCSRSYSRYHPSPSLKESTYPIRVYFLGINRWGLNS